MKKLFLLLPLLLFAVIQARAYDETVGLGGDQTFNCTNADSNGDYDQVIMSGDYFQDLQVGDQIRLSMNSGDEAHGVFAKINWGSVNGGTTLLEQVDLKNAGGTKTATFTIGDQYVDDVKNGYLRIVVRRSANEVEGVKLGVALIKKNRTATAAAQNETGYIVERNINYSEAWGAGHGIAASAFQGVVKAGDVLKVDLSTNNFNAVNLLLGQWNGARQSIAIEKSILTGSDGNYSYRSLPLTQAQADLINNHGVTVQHSGDVTLNNVSVIMKRGLDSYGANLFWYSSCMPKGSWSMNDGNAIKFDKSLFTEAELKGGYSTTNGGLCIYYTGTGSLDWCTFVTGDCGYSTTEWGQVWHTQAGDDVTRDKVRTQDLGNGLKRAWIQFNSDDKLTQVLNNGVTIVGDRTDICIVGAKIDKANVNPGYPWTDVSGVKIYKSGADVTGQSITTKKGATGKFSATITPDNASNKKVHWESSNTDVVTIDQSGNAHAVGNGQAIITVRAWDNHNITATYTVNVGSQHDFAARAGANGENLHILAPVNNIRATYPLVISLHGAGLQWGYNNGDPNTVGAIDFYMYDTSEKPFVYVRPQGTYQSSRGAGWDATREQIYGDVEYMKWIVDELANNPSKYGIQGQIDRKQVYIAGHSNGGMLAYEAIAQAPDYFAGGASTGGFPLNEFHLDTSGNRPVPFFHIQGGNDNAVAIQQTLNNGGTGHLYYDFDNIIDNMVYRNGCYPQATVDETVQCTGSSTTTNVRKRLYTAVGDGIAADFQFHYVEQMGHTWWAGDMGYDIPAEIWNFFKARPLNDTPHQLQFRAVLKSEQAHQNGFDATQHGWHYGKTIDVSKTATESQPGVEWNDNNMIIAAYGEGKTDEFFSSYNPATGGYTEHQWGNHNIYHSIQLDGSFGNNFYVRFNTAANNADYVKINLYKYVYDKTNDVDIFKNPTRVTKELIVSKKYNVNQIITMNFTGVDGWAEYYVEFEKGKAADDTELRFFEVMSGTYSPESGEYFYDPTETVPLDLQLVKQPVYGRYEGGRANEYFVFAEKLNRNGASAVPRTVRYDGETNVGDNANGSWTLTGKDTQYGTLGQNKTIAHIFGTKQAPLSYPADKEKGICISKFGQANFAAYAAAYPLNDENSALTKGTLVLKVAGTLDISFYIQNLYEYDESANGFNREKRRRFTVWYMNDYLDRPQPFFGDNFNGSWDLPCADRIQNVQVRLPHLGTDGTCYIYLCYEGWGMNGQNYMGTEIADEMVWIKGIEIKRPDLKVTIGRTDTKFDQGNSDTRVTAYGEYKPYVWKFENDDKTPDPYFIKSTDAVKEKSNMNDYRTYVLATLPNGSVAIDHILVYSEYASSQGHFVERRDNEPAHIQFDSPTQIRYYQVNEDGTYKTDDNGNKITATATEPVAADVNANIEGSIFDPIVNDGLKVNVTGSGWFKVRAKVPNPDGRAHAVKMTVMTSPNGGNEHIKLLRYFKLPADGQYHEYVSYLKASAPINNPTKDPETQQQSLFVVFEDINEIESTVPVDPSTTGVWEGDKNNFQVNISRMEWLNEDPDALPDYVFQREQYLFKSLQPNENDVNHRSTYAMRSRQQWPETGTAKLYWQAGGGSKNAAYMKQGGKVVDYAGQDGAEGDITIYDKDGNQIENDNTILEDGAWAFDKNWQMVSGGTNPKVPTTTTTTTYSEFGLTPDRGILAGKDGDGGYAAVNFGGYWDMAAMPAFGLSHFVESDGELNPNTDGVYAAKCEHNNVSPLFQAAHTEKQYPRIDKTLDKQTWTSAQEISGADTDEFNLPISGPFFRFMPMKNVKATIYVVPGNANDGSTIYVLDEAGKILKNTDSGNVDDYFKLGYVQVDKATASIADGIITPAKAQNYATDKAWRPKTVKITLGLRAGKEYFLTSKGMAIGIAAMYFEDEGINKHDEITFGESATDNASKAQAVFATFTGSNEPAIRKYTSAKINRKFEAGKWYSLVLPFSMNEAMVEDFFGEGTKCLHYEVVADQDNDGKEEIYLLHHRYNMITAGRPIFIRPTKTVENGTLSDVTIQTSTVTPYADPAGRYKFVGVYDNGTQMAENSIVLGNKNDKSYLGIYTTKKDTKGLRAWIEYQSDYNGDPINVNDLGKSSIQRYDGTLLDEDEATGILEVIAETFGVPVVGGKSSQVYDLNGRPLGKDIDNLPAGVYVVNGKKIVK